MTRYLLGVCWCVCALVGCTPAATPEQALKDSFVQQIASVDIVRDLQHTGDEVSFSARRGDVDAKWRVVIDSAAIERQADGATPRRGVIKSSWFVNGEQIRPRGSQSDLPLAFLDRGLAQECWADWDSGRRQWSWE